MQETLNTLRPSPETRCIENIRIAKESGGLNETLRPATITEEQTHAAEILASITGRAVIPRDYKYENGEILDEYSSSLREVLDLGITDAEAKVSDGMLGANKELRRRRVERSNLEKIVAMPIGFALIEWSPTDWTWTDEEKKAHGYPGGTMARVTAKVSGTVFKQFNVILQSSDPNIINQCRMSLEPGVAKIWDAEEMLASPQIVGLGSGGLQQLSRQIEANYIHALLGGNDERSIKNVIKAIRIRRQIARELNKTNSWDYVVGQVDVFDAMFDSFIATSSLSKDEWLTAVSLVRGGAWHKLINRHEGEDKSGGSTPEELRRSAQQAAIGGFVFTGCGGSIDMKSLVSNSPNVLERMAVVATLGNMVGVGVCSSCGATTMLYGCNVFCGWCNKVWCEAYVLTGKQLEPDEIRIQKYYRYSRASSFGW